MKHAALAVTAALGLLATGGGSLAQGSGSPAISKAFSDAPLVAGPAPRALDGRPDLTGFWKPIREPGKPGGPESYSLKN